MQTQCDVGLGFRGNNSFHMVPDGLKRSLSINLDAWREQKLLGHTSLNLLNSNQDPTFLRSILYLDVARQNIPAPKANLVRVVINGELWGLYVNPKTFSKQMLKEQLSTSAGTLWKSPNNSFGGVLNYLGDDLAPYRRWYEIKGTDDTLASMRSFAFWHSISPWRTATVTGTTAATSMCSAMRAAGSWPFPTT